MTAATPGQADPWRVIADVTCELLRGGQNAGINRRAALRVLADAGVDFDNPGATVAAQEPKPAPELAAAMRETRKVLDLLDDFTHAVIDLDDGARLVAIDRIAKAARAVRRKAGLPPVEGK